MQKRILFRQLIDGNTSTYTYILGDPKSGEAIIIDPVLEQVERDLKHIEEMGLTLKYSLETHIHADHVTGSGTLRERTGCAIMAGEGTALQGADRLLRDGSTLTFGSQTLTAISTPGHTNGCMSYSLNDMVFTGDALMIRSCGRTDFQEGSAEALFHSITKKLYTLPTDTVVYPAHDYKGQTSSTIQEEMKYNKRIFKDQQIDAFVKVMGALDLPTPQKIDIAVPANQACGTLKRDEISAEVLVLNQDKYTIVDVRTEKEYEEGHIKGAMNVPLGRHLNAYIEATDSVRPHVFVCKIGHRSHQAAESARELKFETALNLKGGMQAWIKQNLPMEQGKSPR